ncbi:MAG: hypothetical protein LBU80_02420, partial [Rikenellaceae bacterium]|nr:hypothetical protein [Rikenellaceae bacterium]
YYGAGANLGGWRSDAYYDATGNRHYDYPFTLGIDGMIGLEYKVPEVPLSVGVDYKPCFNLFGEAGFKWYDFGLSVRVLF